MKKKILFLLSLFAIGITISMVIFNNSESKKIKLGGYIFDIPLSYSRENSNFGWLAKFSGFDDGSNSYMLEFSAEEMAANIPGYKTRNKEYKEDIRAILSILTPVEVERYQHAEQQRDLWYLRNFYQDAAINKYIDKGWFMVSGKYEKGRLWSVVKKMPSDKEEFPESIFDFWVADCFSGASPLTKSGKIVNCRSYVFYENIAIDFYVSEENLEVIESIRDYLRSKIESWKISAQ